MIGSDPRSPARTTSAADEEEWRQKPQERKQTLKRDESRRLAAFGQREASPDRQTLKGNKTEERRLACSCRDIRINPVSCEIAWRAGSGQAGCR